MILFLFGVAVVRDTLTTEWRGVQRRYYREHAKEGVKPDVSIRQIQLADFNRVDRCTTCHLAVDDKDPAARTAPHPYRSHPGSFLKSHPPEVYGCTICHQGQGMALTAEAAHGYRSVATQGGKEHGEGSVGGAGHWNELIKHLDHPILKGANIEAACVKCHQGGAVEKTGARTKDATPHWTKGRALFAEFGCIGCHALHGEGGKAAPELTEVGAKFPDQFDMRHLKGEHSVQRWLYEHFLDPQAVVQADKAIGINFPSDMPNARQFGMTEDDARALTAYMLSFTSEHVSSKYFVPGEDKLKEPKGFASRVERGRYAFKKLGCIGCHGREGRMEDIRSNWNAKGGVVPKLGNLADRYNREELKEFILRGSADIPKENDSLETPPLWMPSWSERGLKGEELEALVDYLFTVKKPRAKGEEEW